MAQVSPVDICNLALGWLGVNTISDFKENSHEANVCRANYDPARLSVLEEREWTFAIKRAKLNLLADAPTFEWDYQFVLPTDFLRSINAYENPQSYSSTIQHVFENHRLLANTQTVYLKYMFDLEDSNMFSGIFVQCLAAHVASSIAMPLTANTDLQMTMLQLYQDKLERAAATDALQGSRERLERSQLERSRRLYSRFD